MNSLFRHKGFALPTVLISSVVMMSVLLVSLSSISSISKSIQLQYQNKLLDEAVEAGLAYAKACFEKDDGSVNWTYLYPGSTCDSESQCTIDSDATCWIYNDGAFRTTFEVSAVNFESSGNAAVYITAKAVKVRASSGEVAIAQSSVKKALLQSVATSQEEIRLPWRQISAGGAQTCAVTSSNKAYCWGDNTYGQLGNNSTTDSSVPVAVLRGDIPADVTLDSVSVGRSHSCALGSDGKAYCWGRNNYGQLGNGTTNDSDTPVAVSPGAVPAGVALLSVSAGGNHTCAMGANNKAYCWGYAYYGQLGNNSLLVTKYTTPVAVSQSIDMMGATLRGVNAGANHTCALGSNNNAYCWGSNDSGQLGRGASGSNGIVPILVARGDVPLGVTLESIVADGDDHTCALGSNNKAYCWGENNNGELGFQSAFGFNSLAPAAVSQGSIPSGVTLEDISLGDDHTCAVGSDGKAYCWGLNSYGQLGGNSPSPTYTPVAISQGAVPTDATLESISTGDNHACALGSNGEAYCWGRNNHGQLGNNSTDDSSTSVAVHSVSGMPAGLSGGTKIAAGNGHACAIASGNNAYCWGGGCTEDGIDFDYYLETGEIRYITTCYPILGNGTSDTSSIPVVVPKEGALADKSILSLSASGRRTCALVSDHKAYCWGSSSTATGDDSAVPVAAGQTGLLQNMIVREVTAGDAHTCAIASDGKAYCWGNNGSGRLGNNSTTTSWTPVAVYSGDTQTLGGKTLRQISAGGSHTCAIASDGKAYCWGDNAYDQLGDGTNTDRKIPVSVTSTGALSGKTLRQISAGHYATCVVASDNKAYCWGANYGGALGIGSTDNFSNVPAAVAGGLTFSSISAGDGGACGITTQGKAYCWGYNTYGQLGNGTTAQSNVPVAVIGLPSDVTFVSIARGGNSTCAITADDKTYCWGYNAYGQLGNDSTTNSSVPVLVQPFPPQQSLSAPGYLY